MAKERLNIGAHSESNKVYVFTTPPDANGVSAELHLTPKEAQARLATLIGERIPRAGVEQRDDLKRINGIGPFIAEKLNSVGIYTFEQITYFDDNFIYILTAAIGFFPDRIKRGRWVEQAKELWEEKEYSRLELPKHSADSGVNY